MSSAGFESAIPATARPLGAAPQTCTVTISDAEATSHVNKVSLMRFLRFRRGLKYLDISDL